MTAPKPVKLDKKKLEKQIEAMVKAIIFWRDGQVCVQHAAGGCGNGLGWGHYIAQGKSSWLRYDLGNVFVQCGTHNLNDKFGDKSYSLWFINTFGLTAAIYMDGERARHIGKARAMWELDAMLKHYDELYQDRFYVNLEIDELVRKGYYGETIKAAWLADGRIK